MPAPAREVADGAVGLLVDAAREEAGELAAAVVEDAERDVARPGEVGRGLQQPVEHRLEVELGQQPAPGVDEPREPVLVQAFERRHGRGELSAVSRRPADVRPRGGAGTTRTGQAAWRRSSWSAPTVTRTSTSPRVCATTRAGAAARDARRRGGGRQAPGRGRATPRRRLVAGRDEADVGADALGERGGEQHAVVGRPGRPAGDGDASRREGPDEAVSIGRHATGHGASASSLRTPGSWEIRFCPTTIASGCSRRAERPTASAKGRPESGR